VRDGAGWLLVDRFVLGPGAHWPGLGFTEGRPYFATLVIVADRGLEAFGADVASVVPADESALAAAARLPRRGVLVRVVAATAHALTTVVRGVWALARRHVLDMPALDLRKL
jgi:hypothetical protein